MTFLPQTDGRAPANSYAPEALPSPFSRPSRGTAAGRETSGALCGVQASCRKTYARRSILLNRHPDKSTGQRVRKCASFFRSNCFFERFGRKTEPRTICGSQGQSRTRQSSVYQASARRPATTKSSRFSVANTASNSCSTSWAMRGHPGSRLSARPRTLARCVVNSPNSNAGSRKWKWASNREAA